MPNKVDDFVPYRFWVYIMARLNQIEIARGYNTTPFVTDNEDDFNNSTAKFSLFVEVTTASPTRQGVGGDGPQLNEAYNYSIVGIARFETESPRMLAFALEQDVRTAIHSDVKNIRDSVGRGASLRFSGITHDGGFLAPDKEAGFRLGVTFTWSQKSDW